MILRLIVGLALLASPSLAADRVLTVGGSITEIAFALGQGDRLVARDATSTFPAEAEDLPDVGYMRALSPEGVLSLAPDLIIAEEGAGPAETIEVLETARVPIVIVEDDPSVEGLLQKIRMVGDALGASAEANALSEQVADELERAQINVETLSAGEKKKVLFILSTQGGRILASGTNTAASSIIEMAGGVNANTGFEGYKPITEEAVAAIAPDAILMMDRGGDHDTAADELFEMPALAGTPAAKNEAVVRMDGLFLLGFGPRTAQAVTDLSAALYGG